MKHLSRVLRLSGRVINTPPENWCYRSTRHEGQKLYFLRMSGILAGFNRAGFDCAGKILKPFVI